MLLLLFQGRRIKKLEELYGIQHGNNQPIEDTNNVGIQPHTQEELAKMMGIPQIAESLIHHALKKNYMGFKMVEIVRVQKSNQQIAVLIVYLIQKITMLGTNGTDICKNTHKSKCTDEQALNLEISENEVRKDSSKSERIEYARRLERIESAKAEERMKSGVTDPVENFPQGKVRDIVASKLDIGSGKQYEREKFIIDNQDQLTLEDFQPEIKVHQI